MTMWVVRAGMIAGLSCWVLLAFAVSPYGEPKHVLLCLPMGAGAILAGYLGWRFRTGKVAFLCGMGIVIILAAFFLFVLIPFPSFSLDGRFPS